MILHIHSHYTIFTRLSTAIFNEAGLPGKHICLARNDVFNIHEENGDLVIYGSHKYHDLLRSNTDNYSLIIFHGLLGKNLACLKDIINLKNHPPVVWIIYGAEIETNSLIPSGFLGPYTSILYYRLLPYRLVIPFYRASLHLNGLNLKKLLKGVDYYAHFMKEEVDFVIKHTGINKPQLWHSYAIIEDFIEPVFKDRYSVKQGDILIGNSASFTSNHTEIFRKLLDFDLSDTNLVVPVNYGNTIYKKYILTKGKKLFGNKFKPLSEILSKEEYHRVMSGCSVLILNSYKQQALGNIISAAWMGLKIYLHDFTTSYQYFKRIGLIIFSIDKDLIPGDPEVFRSLDEDQIIHNRNVLSETFCREHVVSMINQSFRQFVKN